MLRRLFCFVIIARLSKTKRSVTHAGLHLQGQDARVQGGAGRVRLASERPAELVLQQRLPGDGSRGASSAALTRVAIPKQAMLVTSGVGSPPVIDSVLKVVGFCVA